MSQKLERREKGTGTVYQDKNGIWRGKLRYTPEPHAKQVTVNFTGKSEADIRKQIREYNKSGAQTVPNKNVTLGSYAEHWLKTFKRPNMKPASYDKLETTYLKHVKPALGMVQLKQIKPSDIQKLIAQKKADGYSYSTVLKVYQLFTALMRFAIGNRDLVYNPTLMVIMPEKSLFETKEIRIFTDEEVERIVEAARATYSNGKPVYQYGEAFVLMLNTGIRLGEGIGLCKTDCNRDNQSIHVQRNIQSTKKRDDEGNATGGVYAEENSPKTYSGERYIPLNKEAVKALDRLCARHPESKWVVCTENGDVVPPDRFERTFYSILKRAGIEKTGMHALRHTFASNLFAKGVDVKAVSHLLGHSSVKITYDTYIHLIKGVDREAVAVLDEA